jgi:hypothetical protein
METATQRRVPEDLNLQLHCCENLKTRNNNNNNNNDNNIEKVSKTAIHALYIKNRTC